MEWGQAMLTTAVFAVIITAPLGAIMINTLGTKWLIYDGDDPEFAAKQQQPPEGVGDGENPTAKKLKGISDEESSGGVVRDFDDSDNIINGNGDTMLSAEKSRQMGRVVPLSAQDIQLQPANNVMRPQNQMDELSAIASMRAAGDGV